MHNKWLFIILLFLSTYLSRFIGLETMARRKMNPTLHLYFSYVPVAIISALLVTQVLTTANGQTVISFPVLIGCLATAILIKFLKMFLPSVVLGVAIGLLARYFL